MEVPIQRKRGDPRSQDLSEPDRKRSRIGAARQQPTAEQISNIREFLQPLRRFGIFPVFSGAGAKVNGRSSFMAIGIAHVLHISEI
jgi:hypothetical protein